jgi:chromosome segregation ATPase
MGIEIINRFQTMERTLETINAEKTQLELENKQLTDRAREHTKGIKYLEAAMEIVNSKNIEISSELGHVKQKLMAAESKHKKIAEELEIKKLSEKNIIKSLNDTISRARELEQTELKNTYEIVKLKGQIATAQEEMHDNEKKISQLQRDLIKKNAHDIEYEEYKQGTDREIKKISDELKQATDQILTYRNELTLINQERDKLADQYEEELQSSIAQAEELDKLRKSDNEKNNKITSLQDENIALRKEINKPMISSEETKISQSPTPLKPESNLELTRIPQPKSGSLRIPQPTQISTLQPMSGSIRSRQPKSGSTPILKSKSESKSVSSIKPVQRPVAAQPPKKRLPYVHVPTSGGFDFNLDSSSDDEFNIYFLMSDME